MTWLMPDQAGAWRWLALIWANDGRVPEDLLPMFDEWCRRATVDRWSGLDALPDVRDHEGVRKYIGGASNGTAD